MLTPRSQTPTRFTNTLLNQLALRFPNPPQIHARPSLGSTGMIPGTRDGCNEVAFPLKWIETSFLDIKPGFKLSQPPTSALMNWRQGTKKPGERLITALSFQPDFHAGRSERARVVPHTWDRAKRSRKNSRRRKGWGGRANHTECHRYSSDLISTGDRAAVPDRSQDAKYSCWASLKT